MAFRVGQLNDTPLLSAYATQRQLQHQDKKLNLEEQALDIEKAYKEGLISNQERELLLNENKFNFDKKQYEEVGKDYTKSMTAGNNVTTATNQWNLDRGKEDYETNLISNALLNDMNSTYFNTPDMKPEDLITYDSETGNFAFNPQFTADNYGPAMNAQDMRRDLTERAIKANPDVDSRVISQKINENFDKIYGDNMNAFHHDFSQYLGQAYQNELQNADIDGDGKVSPKESKEFKEKLNQFIGTNENFFNVMSPGLMAMGMDPSAMMVNIAGTNVPVTSDAASYQNVVNKSKDFDWKLDIDKDGNTSWKKVYRKNDVDDSPNAMTNTDEELIKQKYDGSGYNYGALYKNQGIRPSDITYFENIGNTLLANHKPSFWKDDPDTIKLVQKGGKLYLREGDSWAGNDDDFEVRVKEESDGSRRYQIYGKVGQTKQWFDIEELNGDDKFFRDFFEG